MQQADRAGFKALMTTIHGYYRQDVTKDILELWWNALQGFDLEMVREGLQAHVTDPDRGQWAPRIADMARLMQGTTTERAAIAWGLVLRNMQAVGAYANVDFGDPAIHAAIHDLGGWVKCCRTDLDELTHVQRRFENAYRAYQTRGVTECPLVLRGDCSADEEWEKKGLPAPSARLLGARPCAEVMASQQKRALAQEARKALRHEPAASPGAQA